MSDLQKFYPIVEKVAEVVDYMMVDEMGLMPPEQYDLNERGDRVYVTASFNPLALGRSLKAYENPDVARRLQSAMDGLPVTITRKTGTHYVILLNGKISLPRSVDFPGFGERDVFRLGIGLRGEIYVGAKRLQNVIIGAGQGAGKSNIQSLLVHQARAFGWRLYLADPDGHTFNPDVWNGIAASAVASSPADVLLLLDRIAGELSDRVALFRQAASGGIPPADLDAYNQENDPLPRIAFAVDEANSYLGDKRVFAQMADLLRRGRKWGLHIFLSGHEWHKDTVPAEVNDMLQTRIGLTVAAEQTSAVVLRSSMWGKRVMGKPAGRGVMRTNRYEPMQFYLVTDEMEREWLGRNVVTPAPLPDEEALLVRRSLEETEGIVTITSLIELGGLTEWRARVLIEQYEKRGWLSKDPTIKNARRITPKLAGLVSNTQTAQTPSNTHIWSQTDLKPSQTPNMAGA
ncbi:MAG: hypothetical protein ACOYZ6_07975 [Chloroflexota bacterium]